MPVKIIRTHADLRWTGISQVPLPPGKSELSDQGLVERVEADLHDQPPLDHDWTGARPATQGRRHLASLVLVVTGPSDLYE